MSTTAPPRHPSTALARVLCALVALAAGVVGIAMLVAPGATDRYFAWALGARPLAALVGACYVASTAVFGWAAAREPWPGLRGLCIAVFGLSIPTLLATGRHTDVFDFGRWQAVAWVVLFIASPTLFGFALWLARQPIPAATPRLRPWARAVLVVVGAFYAVLAVTLWAWPGEVSRHGPLAAGPMGLRFVGSWAAFLSILAIYAAKRPSWREARVPVMALAAWPLAGLAAAVGRLDELRSGQPRVAYVAAVSVLAGIAVTVAAAGRADAPSRRSSTALSEPVLGDV